jgi:hydrogenase maturation protein HypF
MLAAGKRAARRAVRLRITGIVQGVGFRPFVYRTARTNGVAGWVLNGDDGVHVVAEADEPALETFLRELRTQPPPAARIASFDVTPIALTGLETFAIRESVAAHAPTVRISPDLPVCDDCLRELFDPHDRRFNYPYINCTNCGPRYSIVLSLPYDRARTVMRAWELCEDCRREYEDPGDRRFHAQPVACPACGPTFRLRVGATTLRGTAAFERTAGLLAGGAIVAIKGLGGYHLACDAGNAEAVRALRERKFRKERPFAVMARDLETARSLVELDAGAERRLTSLERPIVLAPAKTELPGVAPLNRDLGVMLPYTPVHYLVFAAGAPDALVMTSANRSSEPIAYIDAEAFASLAGIADAFLSGERPIARRIDDSLVRAGEAGGVLRRARGMAPQAVAAFPSGPPILALGGDLKSAITLVVEGQAFASQHIGDLEHLSSAQAFSETVRDLCAMYDVPEKELVVAHDLHPGYRSTEFARSLPGKRIAVQHHRAHVASVLAERGAWHEPALCFAWDGTGYGDDGSIWGGEIFEGSIAQGFRRIAHLRSAALPGGDAAARFPVQAAAGFLWDLDEGTAFELEPFDFPVRYAQARELVARNVRTFATTSMGRLFDTVAALLGFTREQSFEGQAAMWLEHLARSSSREEPYPFPHDNGELDFRPMLRAIVAERKAGQAPADIARAFHSSLAGAVVVLARDSGAQRVVASGGVFQNALLIEMLRAEIGERLWTNVAVPPNDGGLSLGQAALAAFSRE